MFGKNGKVREFFNFSRSKKHEISKSKQPKTALNTLLDKRRYNDNYNSVP